MIYDQVKKLIAKQMGLTIAQDEDDINDAVAAALEDVGIHMTLPDCISAPASKALTIGSNYVEWDVFDYAQIVSMKYVSGDIVRPLDKKEASEFSRLNAAYPSDYSTDILKFYCLKNSRVYVGPGTSASGGSIVYETQRRLTTDDIPRLPDGNLVVVGAKAKLGDKGAMSEFQALLAPVTVASQPVHEQYNQRQQNPQILADEINRRSL
jgi:hypothetical protein